MNEKGKVALIHSKKAPTKKQLEGIKQLLEEKWNMPIEVRWEADEEVLHGFFLTIDSLVYEWTPEGKFRELRKALNDLNAQSPNFLDNLKKELSTYDPKPEPKEIGIVEEIGDDIAFISGLETVTYGEIVEFDNGFEGMVMDIKPERVGAIIFGDDSGILEGGSVSRTGRRAGIPVGESLLGRVINALGEPIDGKEPIHEDLYYPIEHQAPGILERKPVFKPMMTGLLAIDSMFPIGCGQRELIIGDRQTGKTAIALDTILNQKDKGVICIYVAIGQKATSVAQIVRNLEKRGAMDYTVVLSATAGEPASMQYISPYAGSAVGEYFMNQGRDVLIIYDDLSKHAIAYRSLSLLLERSPGREAYPGDVFYLHSRLLERSAQLSDELGGGSMTALPIVETQAGDVSAYIPTNIISITDGQIFLESDLFFAGQRPAVNVGLSVSRVGGAAQSKGMKKASGPLRLDLAQYREMEVFTQFASDLDEQTKALLQYGAGLMMLLKQEQYHPLSNAEQIIILTVGLSKLLIPVPVKDVRKVMFAILEEIRQTHPEIMEYLKTGAVLKDDMKETVLDTARTYIAGVRNEQH